MKCERCKKEIVKEDCHGWMICPLEPRDISPLAGKWTRHMNIERNVHAKDILQPVDRFGGVNKHFRKVYGDTIIRKEYKKNEEVMEQLKKPI